MNTIKRISVMFLQLAVSVVVTAGCSGMLDVPTRLPLLQNLMAVMGLTGKPGITVTSPTGAYFLREITGSTLDITVVLNTRPTDSVSFTTATAIDATNTGANTTYAEGDPSTSSLTFTSSNWDVPQTITVTSIDDYVLDGNQKINLLFGSVVSGDKGYNGMAIPSVPITVLDDESYSITVSPETLQTTESSGFSHTATFYVALSTQPLFDVVIPMVTSSDLTEGTVDTSTLTFTTANWDFPQAVTVTGVDDGIEDGNQTYPIQLADSQSLDVGYNGLNLSSVSITNIDSQASITVTPLTMSLVEGGDNAEWGNYQETFSVVLNGAPSGDVTIPVTSGDITRATLDKSSLTFTTGNWSTPQVVTVTAVDNAHYDDPSIPVIMDLGIAIGGGYDGKEPSDVTVYIDDDDGAGIRVSRMSRETREAGLQNATFKVKLTSAPAAGSTVIIPINDQYDIKNYHHHEGFIDKTSLTFNDSNWSTEQVVTVTPVKDYEMDGDVQYIIALLPVVSGDAAYSGKKPRNVTVNNFNEDIAGFVVTANSATTTMGSSGQSFSGFATDDMGNLGYRYATYDIKLRSKPLSVVTLVMTSSSVNNDGMFNVPSLTFTPTNWNVAQTVRITGTSDGTNEGNHNYTASFNISTSDLVYGNVAATYVGKPSFTVTSCDNDGTKDIVECSCSGTNTSSTSESGGQALFYLITKAAPGTDISVNFSVDDVTEGMPPIDGTVIITSENYNKLDSSGSNRVVVTGVDDVLFDGTITYHLLPGLSTGGLTYQIPGNYTMYNSDNETRYVTSVAGHTSEDITTATVNVRLGAMPSDDVTMDVACADATECRTVSPTTLTFTTVNWNTNQQVTVTGEDDSIADGNISNNIGFTVTSTDTVFNGHNFNVAVINDDNEPPAKAIWVTSVDRNGEMAPGVSTADSYCNGSDTAKPTGIGTATYKAMIVDGSSRVATTTGTDDTGQIDWVIKPGYYYYLWSGGSGSDATSRLFIADAYGLIPFPMLRPFGATGGYWTGMNSNMTTASTSGDNCSKWTLTNGEVDPFPDLYAEYGSSDATDTTSISSGTDTCSAVKRIICVQQ